MGEEDLENKKPKKTVISQEQPEVHEADIEIEDEDYDRNLNWSSPIRYVTQKWICKRKKSVRYQVGDDNFKEFDSRRLVDMRFFLFMGIISNSMFQFMALTNPLPDTNQFQVNIYYSMCTLACIVLISLSHKNMKFILPAMIIHCLRNLAPMFDPEGRRYKMTPDQWAILVTFQTQGVGIYIMLINNSLDRGMFALGAILCILLFLGMVDSTYGLEDQSIWGAWLGTFVFGVISFILFLSIQKKVHKDAFIEIKNKVDQQTEFQTIFNELDESVVILNQENRIVQINKMYKKFIFRYLGESTTQRVEKYTKLYEALEIENNEERELQKKSKVEKCCSYICCWRPNKKPKINLLDDQIRNYQQAENDVLSKKIFQRFLSKAQKEQIKAGSSVASMGGGESFHIKKNDSVANLDSQPVSLSDLIKLDAENLNGMSFEIINRDKDDVKSFVQIRKKQYLKGDQERMMLQFIDISNQIMYEQVHAENEFLAITNATVSHELRNPLQSISSQNLKIKLCLKELMNIMRSKQNSSVQQIEKSVREIVSMIDQSNKISDSSTNMMGFLVDDLLDFAQINAGKFRKVCKEFDLREAIDEVISIQQEKAMMQGIKLRSIYQPQSIGSNKVLSLFSKPETKEQEGEESGEEEHDEKDDNLFDYDFALQHNGGDKKEPLQICTDKRRLQQVILNIQSNALKFTDSGGEVSVIYSLYKQNGVSYCEVQIKDTGMGIKRKDKKKLFKLFGFVQSTEDVNTRGIGLGLVICKKIVERFDGTIGFKSKWLKGSTFGFRIQLDKQLQNTQAAAPKIMKSPNNDSLDMLDETYRQEDQDSLPAQNDLEDLVFGAFEMPANVMSHLPSIHRKGPVPRFEHEVLDVPSSIVQERILIVDDEPFILDALRIVLQCATADRPNIQFKDRVDTANNGLKAVEMVKKQYAQGFIYKLILMDCNMPKMDGYQASLRIREYMEEIQMEQPFIVALTGHIEEKYRQRALDAGMNCVVGKPARLQELQEAIKSVMFS